MHKTEKEATVAINAMVAFLFEQERMKNMKERLSKLLTVKSIVTIALTIVFCVLSVTGELTGRDFLTIFTTVIAFYFGTQVEKSVKVEEVKDGETNG